MKLAGTWEGIRAARILEKDGITCNITLIFGFAQGVAAAQAGARLISPFPGRVKDWFSANGGAPTYEPDEDPGVVVVRRIYEYYKKHGHGTICMPASWRPSRGTSDPSYAVDEILALAGTYLCGNQIYLRRISPESPRRLPRHRRDTCSMAWQFRFLTARHSG